MSAGYVPVADGEHRVPGTKYRATLQLRCPYTAENVEKLESRWRSLTGASAHYALDHFKVKLLKLPEGMLTATGRRLATERTVVMRRFLADLAQELLAPAPDW